MPMSGCNMVSSTHAPVTAMASMVCEATCPRFSPVTRQPQPWSRAMRSEIIIMNRRMISVKNSYGQLSRMAS